MLFQVLLDLNPEQKFQIRVQANIPDPGAYGYKILMIKLLYFVYSYDGLVAAALRLLLLMEVLVPPVLGPFHLTGDTSRNICSRSGNIGQ